MEEFASRLTAAVLRSQAYVRERRLDRVHVSIRDLLRAFRVYKTVIANTDVLLPKYASAEDSQWAAIIIAIALAYMLRLPPDVRVDFAIFLDDFLGDLPGTRRSPRRPAHLCVDQVTRAAFTGLYRQTGVPVGIAPTSALQENIYACVACLLAGIPLNITGP